MKVDGPRSRLDKLGVKEGMRVFVGAVGEEAFLQELRSRGARVVAGRPASADMVFLACHTPADLGKLEATSRQIVPDGAIWALWPRGGRMREQDVREAALPLGLVDVKVVAFSEAWSALKLVIRRERRPPRDRKDR